MREKFRKLSDLENQLHCFPLKGAVLTMNNVLAQTESMIIPWAWSDKVSLII
jgi:hypothetical protein